MNHQPSTIDFSRRLFYRLPDTGYRLSPHRPRMRVFAQKCNLIADSSSPVSYHMLAVRPRPRPSRRRPVRIEKSFGHVLVIEAHGVRGLVLPKTREPPNELRIRRVRRRGDRDRNARSADVRTATRSAWCAGDRNTKRPDTRGRNLHRAEPVHKETVQIARVVTGSVPKAHGLRQPLAVSR